MWPSGPALAQGRVRCPPAPDPTLNRDKDPAGGGAAWAPGDPTGPCMLAAPSRVQHPSWGQVKMRPGPQDPPRAAWSSVLWPQTRNMTEAASNSLRVPLLRQSDGAATHPLPGVPPRPLAPAPSTPVSEGGSPGLCQHLEAPAQPSPGLTSARTAAPAWPGLFLAKVTRTRAGLRLVGPVWGSPPLPLLFWSLDSRGPDAGPAVLLGLLGSGPQDLGAEPPARLPAFLPSTRPGVALAGRGLRGAGKGGERSMEP